MTSILLVQFAKWPNIGKVKTRIAKDLGDVAALSIHKELTSAVYANLKKAIRENEIDFQLSLDMRDDGIDDFNQFCELVIENRGSITLQKGNGLGERMANAFFSNLQKYDAVIIVGSDCPSVDYKYLQSALTALKSNDLVLGPAEDGGYVLIGAKRFDPSWFDSIEWGGNKVLDKTIKNANENGVNPYLLDIRWDIDNLSDYERWKK